MVIRAERGAAGSTPELNTGPYPGPDARPLIHLNNSLAIGELRGESGSG